MFLYENLRDSLSNLCNQGWNWKILLGQGNWKKNILFFFASILWFFQKRQIFTDNSYKNWYIKQFFSKRKFPLKKAGNNVLFRTCKCCSFKISLELILCVRTLKSGSAKQNELTKYFMQEKSSLSARGPICFRRQNSHLKSFRLRKTTALERAKLWSRIWNQIVPNCEQIFRLHFFVF